MSDVREERIRGNAVGCVVGGLGNKFCVWQSASGSGTFSESSKDLSTSSSPASQLHGRSRGLGSSVSAAPRLLANQL
jgi:hypothetical protein